MLEVETRSKKTNQTARPLAGGFTLIELLVVVGIIAVLIAILLPALGRARQEVYKVQCASTLRQWGTAINMFAGDNDGLLPDSQGWQQTPNTHADLMWNENQGNVTEWHHHFIQVYLVGYDESEASAGGTIIHRCPVETRHESFRRDTISYYYLARRQNSGHVTYEPETIEWAGRTRMDGPFSRAPLMTDEYSRTAEGDLEHDFSNHTNPSDQHAMLGGNFMFEDVSVSWHNDDEISLGAIEHGNNDRQLYFRIPIPGLIE